MERQGVPCVEVFDPNGTLVSSEIRLWLDLITDSADSVPRKHRQQWPMKFASARCDCPDASTLRKLPGRLVRADLD
jgi:hypothetical protein